MTLTQEASMFTWLSAAQRCQTSLVSHNSNRNYFNLLKEEGFSAQLKAARCTPGRCCCFYSIWGGNERREDNRGIIQGDSLENSISLFALMPALHSLYDISVQEKQRRFVPLRNEHKGRSWGTSGAG